MLKGAVGKMLTPEMAQYWFERAVRTCAYSVVAAGVGTVMLSLHGLAGALGLALFAAGLCLFFVAVAFSLVLLPFTKEVRDEWEELRSRGYGRLRSTLTMIVRNL